MNKNVNEIKADKHCDAAECSGSLGHCVMTTSSCWETNIVNVLGQELILKYASVAFVESFEKLISVQITLSH